jgi:type I restriction enzyme, S subunit
MELKAKEPKVRFGEFTETWKQRKLSTEFEKVNERNDGSLGREHWISVAKMYFQSPEKVQSNNIDTRTYVMRIGDIAFEGHPNKDFKFGRFVANDIGTGVVSELFPIYRHKQDYNNYYWKNAIQIERIMGPIFSKSITSSGNSSNKLDPNHFLRQPIFIPKLEEQNKIGSFFKQLDNTITLRQQELEQLKESKKTLLAKMFPKEGADRPEIRFAGFTDPWEQCKLGNYIIQYSEVTVENNQYPVFTSSRRGLFFQKDYYDGSQIASEDNTGYNIVPRGYFTYRHMSDDLIFKFNINNLADYGIVSTLYPVFTTTKNMDSKYLQYQLNEGTEFKRFSNLQKQGGSRTYMYLSKLKNLNLTIPSIVEQKKISLFFVQLDDTITLHQKELENLKELKKTLLNLMFV